MVEALGGGGGYEFPFPRLNDSTIKALEESVEFLRELISTDDNGEENVLPKAVQHNDSPWHLLNEEPAEGFDFSLADNLSQLTR